MCTHHDTSTLSGIRGLGASGGDRGCAVRLPGPTILLRGVGRILMVRLNSTSCMLTDSRRRHLQEATGHYWDSRSLNLNATFPSADGFRWAGVREVAAGQRHIRTTAASRRAGAVTPVAHRTSLGGRSGTGSALQGRAQYHHHAGSYGHAPATGRSSTGRSEESTVPVAPTKLLPCGLRLDLSESHQTSAGCRAYTCQCARA